MVQDQKKRLQLLSAFMELPEQLGQQEPQEKPALQVPRVQQERPEALAQREQRVLQERQVQPALRVLQERLVQPVPRVLLEKKAKSEPGFCGFLLHRQLIPQLQADLLLLSECYFQP